MKFDIIVLENFDVERKIVLSYKAIYRKFRPTNFTDVLGQEHITTILKNQIKNNNIAHAYLFSGTRGTGKTSTARIFARGINCLSEDIPCNTCEICRGILEESVMDIVEIDAASNNSVEDIRELRENSKYPPSNCKYKVYIIDEVHMLSKGAFNALLKVLEEPPKHLVFILATTEPDRLPATILSRCQRYDFKRVSVDNIVKNMRSISEKIPIEVDDNALELIARNSDGAMRDALSILDQCLSFSQDKISYDYVVSILGIVNNDLMFYIVDDIISGQISELLNKLESIVQDGIDIKQFIKDLILHFRNLMVAKISQDVENSIDGTEEFIERLRVQSKTIELEKIITYLNILSETENKCKWISQPRIILEVDLIKMIKLPSNTSIDALIERIDKLESQIKSGRIEVQAPKRPSSRDDNINKESRKEGKSVEKVENSLDKISVENENVNFETVKSEWSNILNVIKKKKIALHALITEGKPMSFKNSILTISFGEGFEFHRDALDKQLNKESIENIIASTLNTKVQLKLEMETKPQVDLEQERLDLVKDVIDVFGKDLVEIEE